MPGTIGIVRGLGPEGTVHYYRKLVELLAAIPLEEERPGLAVAHVWIDRFASLLRRGEEDEIVALLASGEKTAPMRERVTEIVDGMASRGPLDAIVVACTDLMELVATTLPVVDPIDCHVRLAAESMTRAPRPSSARS